MQQVKAESAGGHVIQQAGWTLGVTGWELGFVLENCTNTFVPTAGSRFLAFAAMSSPKT